MLSSFIEKVRKRIIRLRLQPIRVFCYHCISDEFDSRTMWPCDWISTDVFKRRITNLLVDSTFITLTEAQEHLSKDFFRFKKYCVLTFDDGSKSIQDIMPWLAERGISVTLFVNPAFLTGESVREIPMHLLNEQDVTDMLKRYGSLISIASHSYKHTLSTASSAEDFIRDVQKAEAYLESFDGKIPFYAYPYGVYSTLTNELLCKNHLVPVLMDEQKNYNDPTIIHREN